MAVLRVPGGQTRGVVGVAPENRPHHTPVDATVKTAFSELVGRYMRETGCTDTAEAMKKCADIRRDLALNYGSEVNAAVDRHAGQRSGWSQHDEQQLANTVE